MPFTIIESRHRGRKKKHIPIGRISSDILLESNISYYLNEEDVVVIVGSSLNGKTLRNIGVAKEIVVEPMKPISFEIKDKMSRLKDLLSIFLIDLHRLIQNHALFLLPLRRRGSPPRSLKMENYLQKL